MPQTEYAIQLEHVTKTFGPVIANHDVTMNIRRGEILSLLGENGSGKTTLMNMIAGIYYPDGGQIIVNGQPADIRSPRDALALGIGMIHQHFKLVDVFTAVENIALSMDKGEKFDLRRVRDKARAICEKYQFALDLDQKVYEMSVSQKQTLEIVKVLFRGADILILDEPTNHLDIFMRETLTDALSAYTGTLLLVTHDRHLMNSLACPILYLEDGKAVLYPSYDALMGRTAPVQAAQKAAEPAKTGYGKEQRRRRAELRAKIKACEDEMEACGAREVELDNEINSPEVYNDPDLLRQKSDELSDLRFHQEELFAAWEAAMEEQEAYEQTQQPEE